MISTHPCKFSLSVETRDIDLVSCTLRSMVSLMQDVVIDLHKGRLVRLHLRKMLVGLGDCVRSVRWCIGAFSPLTKNIFSRSKHFAEGRIFHIQLLHGSINTNSSFVLHNTLRRMQASPEESTQHKIISSVCIFQTLFNLAPGGYSSMHFSTYPYHTIES